MSNYAPIALFVYKRIDCLRLSVESLASNPESRFSDLFIFSDGGKNSADMPAVEGVRKYCRSIEGFNSVKLVESPSNRGLASSIIAGVTSILKEHDSVIVLEDDLIFSGNFLTYMNQALTFYRDNPDVLSICGYSPPIDIKNGDLVDIYFTHRSSSWGWGVWRDRWQKVDWRIADYDRFRKNKKEIRKFNRMGSDMSWMLCKQMKGNIDSWAVRFCYHQFKYNLYSVHPMKSKVSNVGIMEGATHTMDYRFVCQIDESNKSKFRFSTILSLDNRIIKQFIKPYSLTTRIKYKLINAFK